MSLAVWIWLALVLFFIVAEAATVQVVSIWFILGAILGGFCALLGLPVWVQILVFLASSILTLILLRPYVMKKNTRDIVPTNADLNIGKVALIRETVDNERGEGRATVDGIYWTARSYYGDVLPEGSRAVVYAIDGAKLILVPFKEA